MNLHPVAVHFPIALFTIYSLMECVRYKKVHENEWFVRTKTLLVVLGVIFAFIALQTGELLRLRFLGDEFIAPIMRVHSIVASATVWLYAIIACAYAFRSLRPHMPLFGRRAAVVFSNFILRSVIIVPLALVSLIGIMITGALGGAMVYGIKSDPFVAFVYQWLIK